MKPHLPNASLLILTASVAATASLALVLSTPTALVVDGQRLAGDVGPVTTATTAFLPVRSVADAAGADAHYDATTGTITVRRGVQSLVAHVGETTATLDGRPLTLAHAPFVSHGEAMLAGDDFERALGARVRYDARRGRVDVRTPGVVVAGAADDEP